MPIDRVTKVGTNRPRHPMKIKSLSIFTVGVLAGAASWAVLARKTARSLPANAYGAHATGSDTQRSVLSDKPVSGPREITPAGTVAQQGRLDDLSRQAAARILKLKTLGGSNVTDKRQLISELEALRKMGPSALPAIREFLAQGDDVDFDANAARTLRNGKVPLEFLVPPSLRLGLLEVVKDIGGEAGQELLNQELMTAGRGVEIAYIAGALQQMAGDKYHDATAKAVRDLLAMPALPSTNPGTLDTGERDYLYGTLTNLKDKSYVAQAEADVVRADGQLDRASLRYLQSALGEQSVAVAAKLWDNPKVAADRKGPLAQVALNYVGINEQADSLFFKAIDGTSLNRDTRRNLIEDLNQTGFADTKNLLPTDLPLIQKRLALIEASLPGTTDPVNAEAFKEARKDLLDMQARLMKQASP
jgi:hypothetical protein